MGYKPLGFLGGLGGMLLSLTAAAQPAPAITPRAADTGYSSVEQRYVYAPPDEGAFKVNLPPGAGPNEVFIRDVNMCESSAYVEVEYSKADNNVHMRAEFEGLPYRPSFTRSVDISTPWNIHPVQVEDGKWQIWTIGRLFGIPTTLYYDGPTGAFLGTEWDFPSGPPPLSFPVIYPMSHLICSPIFEGEPGGHAVVEWDYDYDQLLDVRGTGGTIAGFVPENICEPDHLIAYYTNGGIPAEDAISWDDVLEQVHHSGIMFATSLEPDPKPDYLLSRDNLMIGHIGAYPQQIPDGYTIELNGFTLQRLEASTCSASVELGDWQGPYYNVCGG